MDRSIERIEDQFGKSIVTLIKAHHTVLNTAIDPWAPVRQTFSRREKIHMWATDCSYTLEDLIIAFTVKLETVLFLALGAPFRLIQWLTK